ncbi:DUF3500 domain-containing protein [Microbacterium phosphatis]|uniref:DUF3500 domain-containing protein n=1 Tax=Microbacterium phosphatis TaxID=3140248 RepID=UPI00313FF496
MVDTTDGEDIDGYFSTARVAGRKGRIDLPADSYASYLYPLDDPRLVDVRGMDYEDFTRDRQSAPFLHELLEYWDGLYREPFVGITTDGAPRPDVYALPEGDRTSDVGRSAVDAAERVLALLSPEERGRFQYPVDAPEWRGWSNPEFVFKRIGLRLEDLEDAKAEAVLALVEASLSPEGYQRVREAMGLNGFLGSLVGLPEIMNERSYWAALYGALSQEGAWGWQLFGHHVAVHFFAVGGREVIAPVFLGAEPALSDGARPPLFEERERIALELAGSLTPEQRRRAIVYSSVLDPSMPEGRLHPADERHVAGAFRDNRVIPYEGIPASALDPSQRSLLREIVADFHLLLVKEQRDLVLADYDAHIDETWFSWYGATDGSQPFYFRVQSPVIIAELDHHAGVWLSNRLPARFHVHTTLRHPNGNDYGRAYLAQWRARSHD